MKLNTPTLVPDQTWYAYISTSKNLFLGILKDTDRSDSNWHCLLFIKNILVICCYNSPLHKTHAGSFLTCKTGFKNVGFLSYYGAASGSNTPTALKQRRTLLHWMSKKDHYLQFATCVAISRIMESFFKLVATSKAESKQCPSVLGDRNTAAASTIK